MPTHALAAKTNIPDLQSENIKLGRVGWGSKIKTIVT